MERRRRTVTVIADASYDKALGCAGWAVWVKSGRRSLCFSGYGPASDSCEAELNALGNGVIAAILRLHLGKHDVVIALSDNEHALGVLSGGQALREDRMGDSTMRENVTALIRQRGISLRPRHVRGHQGDQGKGNLRAAMQSWCDQSARAALSQAKVAMLLDERATAGVSRAQAA